MFIDRKPLSNFGPAFPAMFWGGIIMLVIVPVIGLAMIGCAVVSYLRRKAMVDQRKAAIRAKIAERDRRERILAFKSFPG